MWDFDQPYFEGKLIPAEQAWRTLNDWRSGGKEIGVWYVAKSGSVRTLGTVDKVRNGRLELGGSAMRAGFHLKDATFTHGPMQIFPRWPMVPMVEVMAIQAFLQTGDWLMPAEGMRPEALPPQSLPA